MDGFGVDDIEYECFDPCDEIAQPLNADNWYEELGDASGLDISPDSGLVSPPGLCRGARPLRRW